MFMEKVKAGGKKITKKQKKITNNGINLKKIKTAIVKGRFLIFVKLTPEQKYLCSLHFVPLQL